LKDLSGLERLPRLQILNVSSNQLTNLESLAACSELETLLCARNYLRSYESLASLEICGGLCTLDLQDNELEDVKVC
jgi:Leucine-rich repeat (LRR) protein